MSDVYQKIKSDALIKWNDFNTEKPWIRVGGGVSGQASGSEEIFELIKKYKKNQNLDFNLSLVGSLD